MTDTRSHHGKTPVGSETREAIYALKGYLYQAITSSLAWVRLPDNGTLYLEVADDYAICIKDMLSAHQIKITRRTVTLNDAGVKKSIANLVELATKNPQRDFQQYFHTTSTIAQEHRHKDRLPGQAGLDYWQAVVEGKAELQPLRKWLESDRMPELVRRFCRERNDAALTADLISRIHWLTGEKDYDALQCELLVALKLRLRTGLNLPVQEASKLVDAVIYRVLSTSIQPVREQRQLRSVDLLDLIDDQTHVSVPYEHLRAAPLAAAGTGWEPVVFNEPRGWLPILRGEKLFPGDALTCPRLPEVADITEALKQRRCVHIYGQPGSGKTIAAYQVAQGYGEQGWRVLQHFGDNPPVIDTTQTTRILYLVDDAHLLTRGAIQSLSAPANGHTHVLLLHNAPHYDEIQGDRDTLLFDTRRAVRTIADYFLKHQDSMTPVVRELDRQVGFRMLDTPLDSRIKEAYQKASYPWHFCFILSGGSRRAIEAVKKSHLINAHFTFAAIALHQLIARDASPQPDTILSLLAAVGLPTDRFPKHLEWLAQSRWIICCEDIRLPHQRFAATCLALLADHDDDGVRHQVSTLICAALADPRWPLAGKAMVLEELHATRRFRQQWAQALQPALDECWRAQTASEISAASNFLRHTDQHLDDKGAALIDTHEADIVRWMNAVSPDNGVALGYLIKNIGARDRSAAIRLIEKSDLARVAHLIHSARPETGSVIGHYLLSLSFAVSSPWREQLQSALVAADVLNAASNWRGSGKSENSDLYALNSLSHLCYGLSWIDENLVCELLSAAMPFAQRVFADRPAEALSCFSDVYNFVLGFSVLFERDHNDIAKSRYSVLAAQLTAQANGVRAATQLSTAPLNQYQRSAEFLRFTRKTNLPLFTATVKAIDWAQIIRRITLHGKNPLVEVEHLLEMAWCDETAVDLECHAAAWISSLDTLSARLAILFPTSAWTHLAAGKVIDVTRHWPSGARVITTVSNVRPELLQGLIEPHQDTITRTLVAFNAGEDIGFLTFLRALIAAVPEIWDSLLQRIEVDSIEPVWRNRMGNLGDGATLAVFLVVQCHGHPGALGDLARALAQEFGPLPEQFSIHNAVEVHDP